MKRSTDNYPGLVRRCSSTCHIAPRGWWCSRSCGHDGPCAARPRWWNLKWIWKMRGFC